MASRYPPSDRLNTLTTESIRTPWRSSERDQDINILLIGATGAGKTTMINALANYLSYDSLGAAVAGEMQVLIPSSFIFSSGDDSEEKTILIGKPDKTEQLERLGESATQLCRSFVFKVGNRRLRLIDTPGVGDTRGIEQDEKNFREILSFISQYEHLNGICVLLKSNEDRATITFQFCVNELLRHLHIDGTNNLAFLFTNGRSNFYQPGSSKKSLQAILNKHRDNHGANIPFNNSNVFCFDNEAFRYLALRKHGITLDEYQTESYQKSWNHSVKESLRFLRYVLQCPKHPIRQIISINNVAQLIRRLPRPMAETTRLIEENLQQAQRYKARVLNNPTTAKEGLPQKLGRIRQLQHPRTVCASEKCRRLIEEDDEMRIDYSSTCHDECYLKQVQQETIADEKLEDCTAIDPYKGICFHCGCHWRSHQHITYEYISNRTRIRFPLGTGPIRDNPTVFLNDVDRRITALRQESKTISDIYKRLVTYLRAKAMLPYNDAFLEYIKYFISEEESKRASGAKNDEIITNLKNLMEDYKNHIETLKKTPTLALDPADLELEPEQVSHLVNQLYDLPITGDSIREQVKAIGDQEQETTYRRERQINLAKSGTSSKLIQDFVKALTE